MEMLTDSSVYHQYPPIPESNQWKFSILDKDIE